MSDLFGHPILTVRIHAGFNANSFLAGLLALTGQTAGTATTTFIQGFFMSDLFGHPILTVRIHAGFNANSFLAGLLALTGQTAGTAESYMRCRFPKSDLFGHPILTVRIHAGFNANSFLAGLLALTGQTAGTAESYMRCRFPKMDAHIVFGPRSVNGILGWTLNIVTPHEHAHRTPADIRHIYDESTLSDVTKEKALAIWKVLSEAEARVHGTTVEHIHFHEVGRMANILAIGLIADFMYPC